MMRTRSLICGGIALAIAFAPLGAAAATLTIANGAEIRGFLTSQLSSKTSVAGQPVNLSLIAPYPNSDTRFSGATLSGRVVNVVKAGQGRKAQIEFAIDKIALRGGQTGWFSAKILSVNAQTKSNTGKIALTALGGMVVGNVLGKWAGTNLGGAVGAVAGALYAANSKEDVTVPQGSAVVLQLTSPISLRI